MPARIKKNHRSQKTPVYGKKNRSRDQELGSFRIIGGEWRSRKLVFKAQEGLRPTTDRVKETVFNWLMPYLSGAKVLDVFAGSGSLGFEALSRGAASLTAIEKNQQAAGQLLENAEILKLSRDQARIVCADALEWLTGEQNLSPKYDIVLLDPPFRKGLLDQVIHLLDAEILAADAMIYLEREKEGGIPDIPAQWRLLKEKQAGQVCYQLYQYHSEL